MTDEQVILVGWKDITKAIGLHSVDTAKRWAKRYKMPHVRLCGKVTVPRVVLIEWMRNLCFAVSKEDGKADEFVVRKLKNLGVIK